MINSPTRQEPREEITRQAIISTIAPDLYTQVHALLPIACVDIVLLTPDNGFLLVKRKMKPAQGQWWLVGGRVYKNETLEEAARRKVREEIGIELNRADHQLQKIGGGYETIFLEEPFGHGKGTHTINTCFLARLAKEDLDSISIDQHHTKHKIFYEVDEQWHPYVKAFLVKRAISPEQGEDNHFS